MKYEIEITETITRLIEVEACNINEAYQKGRAIADNGNIDDYALDMDVSTEVNVVSDITCAINNPY